MNKDAIEDIVMDVLSDEGGAAGLEPIEDALEELEDDDVSLPEDPIEDVINDVPGVKRHADGDYIDTTKLEGRRMKVTKRQLARIIREEKQKILAEQQDNRAFLKAMETIMDQLMTMEPAARAQNAETLIQNLQTVVDQAGSGMENVKIGKATNTKHITGRRTV